VHKEHIAVNVFWQVCNLVYRIQCSVLFIVTFLGENIGERDVTR